MDRRKLLAEINPASSTKSLSFRGVGKNPWRQPEPDTPAWFEPGKPGGFNRVQAEEQIRALENQLRESQGVFSWYLHNELRQFYLLVDEKKSMEHADCILAYSLMDLYTLNALSDWHMEPTLRGYSPGLGVVALLDKASRFPSLPHLCTACLIKAGDAQAHQGRTVDAERLYRWALKLVGESIPSTLEPYLQLARSRLDTFRL